MPLTRGEAIGFDADRLFYRFTMMSGMRVVHCEISNVALSDIVKTNWKTVQSGDRESQFIIWRDTIEKVASDLFDAGGGQAQKVQIFAKHFPRR